MIRRGVAALVALACLPASASAAESQVAAGPGFSFSPDSVTIAPNDSVRWTNQGGFHNVKFDDGSFEQPANPSSTWPDPVVRSFPSAGHFRFYCRQHGGPNGSGMSGTVHVVAPGGGGGGGGGGQGNTPARPTVEVLTAKRTRAGGIKVRLRASVGSTARVTLYRRVRGRFRKVRSLKRKVSDRSKTVTFTRGRGRKRLKPGRYRVTVQLTEDGVKGPARSRPITLS